LVVMALVVSVVVSVEKELGEEWGGQE
jgi:hypothetical protein